MRILILIGFLVLSLTTSAQDRDFSKVEIKAIQVSGNIYMLEGAGGNIGVSVGEDGIVIVDDQYAPLADKIRAALKGIADRPVRFVLNTHYHFDHTGGNAPFSKTSTVIAHENVRRRLAAGGVAGNAGSVRFDLKPETAEALPFITFRQDVTLHMNGENIQAMHYPEAHTDGDSIIYFEKSQVAHFGDNFVTYGFPFVDIDGGGSVEGMIRAAESALQALPPDVKIIPGHGPVSTPDDVRVLIAMLKETTAVVKKALAEKKTLDQMKQEKLLDPWKKYSGDFISADAFLETLYSSVTGKKRAGFIQHH